MRSPASIGLILAMAVGSIAMWLVNPVFWLWVGSKLTNSTQPSMGPYLVVIAGVIATMVVLGKLLQGLGELHARVTGTSGRVRVQAPWLRSMRGERPEQRHANASVLDVVMVVSVTLAGLAMAIWFFGFAGSSLPGA